MIDLTVVVLVWQDRAFLRGCLEHVHTARQNLALEVVVVENGVTVAAEDYPDRHRLPVQVFRNEKNRGVAIARNQGLAYAQGRYVMLLDIDTDVTQDAFKTLVRFMDANPDVGLAGPRLQDAQGNLQLTCRKLPTVWTKFLRRVPLTWAQAQLADEQLSAYDHKTPRAVDYVIGACQIIRRSAIERVGLLDAQFFYGPEDVDYCIRMWRDGWRVMYVPQAVVMHNEQRLTRQRALSKLSLVHVSNLARYFWKYKYALRRPAVQPSG